jgi:hypothetical protein
MSEVRDLLLQYLLDLAPTLGNCPDCFGLGWTHEVRSRTTTEERRGHDLIYQPVICSTCVGSGWARNGRPRPRACLHCGRIFQPVAGLGRDWMDWCTYCRRDGLAGRSFALPPHSSVPYGGHEAQPKAGRRGTLADGNATSGLGLVPGGTSGASVQGKVGAARPAGPSVRGRAHQGVPRSVPVKGPVGPAGHLAGRPVGPASHLAGHLAGPAGHLAGPVRNKRGQRG